MSDKYELRFEGCEHRIPLGGQPLILQGAGESTVICHPEILERPLAGKCPECRRLSGDKVGEDKSMVKTLPNWEAFESEIQDLRHGLGNAASPLLFRGQSDAQLSLSTTLERAGCKDMFFSDYYLLVSRIKPAVETFTRANWDIPQFDLALDQSFHDRELISLRRFPSIELYRYMVYLRHHGFPSPLLDWSYSPHIAAFFAFRDAGIGQIEQRSVYVYCEMPHGFKGSSVGEPVIHRVGPYVRSHRRHFRQQSDYTFCARFDESGWRFHPHEDVFLGCGKQDYLWKFNLPSTERSKVLRLLSDYTLDAFSLFDTEESLLETLWLREQVLNQTSR